jgi:ParB-like chromosome segregation protein Spo0J
VAAAGQPDRYPVIDGYKRVAALQQLDRDTVEAAVWPMSEAEALLLDRSLRVSDHETALEQGWLRQEFEQRFGYGLEELARRFDRSVSWVSRRRSHSITANRAQPGNCALPGAMARPLFLVRERGQNREIVEDPIPPLLPKHFQDLGLRLLPVRHRKFECSLSFWS